jgi:hypothetical protein
MGTLSSSAGAAMDTLSFSAMGTLSSSAGAGSGSGSCGRGEDVTFGRKSMGSGSLDPSMLISTYSVAGRGVSSRSMGF